MKILYIASNKREDFMADTIFHGLRSLFGSDVTDLHHLWHMSNTTLNVCAPLPLLHCMMLSIGI